MYEVILTSEVLMTEERKKSRDESVERLKGEDGTDTDASKAQEAVFYYILHVGGAREDVYDYLLQSKWKDIPTVTAIRPLLYYLAPVEWIRLAEKVQEREETFFLKEVVSAFTEKIPVEDAEKMIEESKSLIEVCRRRVEYVKNRETEQEKKYMRADGTIQTEILLLKSMINHLELELSSYRLVSRSEQGEVSDTVTQSEADHAVTDKFIDRKELYQGNGFILGMSAGGKGFRVGENHDLTPQMETGDSDTATQDAVVGECDMVTQSEEYAEHDTVTQNAESEACDMMAQSEEYAECDTVSRNVGSEVCDIVSQNGENSTVLKSDETAPEFPKGDDVMEGKLLVSDLQEKEKAAGRRISFFEELLKMHQKKAFLKLEEEAQVGKLFEIMIAKKYGKEKILAVKRLLDGGMSKEFLYSLIEKDLSEEELNDICDAILGGENGNNRVSEDAAYPEDEMEEGIEPGYYFEEGTEGYETYQEG